MNSKASSLQAMVSDVLKSPVLLYSGEIRCDMQEIHYPRHRHPEINELLLITRGRAEFVVGSRKICAQAGDIIVFNCGTDHEERYCSASATTAFYCAVGRLRGETAADHSGGILPVSCSPIISTESEFETLRFIFSQIARESAERGSKYRIISQNLTQMLLVWIYRLYENQYSIANERGMSELCGKIKEYIDENFAYKVTLKDIAEANYVSPYYLSHLFKKETGYSPISYLIRRRIDKSKQLLLTTSKSVQEIASLVGYDNSAHFISIFKKVTGNTPSNFRRKAEESA
mgnify:CR=1 FL=1